MAYLCQAPKEYRDQSAIWRKQHPLPKLMDSGNYIAQRKYDGCCCIIDTTLVTSYSRTGEHAESMMDIAEALFGRLGPGFKVYGEAYRPGWEFQQISGEFRRHKRSAELQLVVWDIVEQGDEAAPYNFRMTRATGLNGLPRVFIASRLKEVTSTAEAFSMALQLQESGGFDGVILRDVTAGWAPGAAKNGEVIKVKPRLSLDLPVTGWFPGKGKLAGKAGGIVVKYGQVLTEVGTGFTDEQREEIAKGMYIYHNPGRWIAEVECLGTTPDGKLREPSFKGWRFDKEGVDG